MPVSIRQLGPEDLADYETLMSVFGKAFEDLATYEKCRPGPAYMSNLLASSDFIALAAFNGGQIVGGRGLYTPQVRAGAQRNLYL